MGSGVAKESLSAGGPEQEQEQGQGQGETPPRTAPAAASWLDAARAHVVVWLGVALVNALNIALLPWPYTGVLTRVFHHAFDLGHSIAIALLGYSLVLAWRRVAPRSPRLALSALAAFAVLASPFLLTGDFANWAERHERDWLAWPAAACASLVVPAAWWVGAKLRRPTFRWAAVAVSASIAAVNHHVLKSDYPGIHLYASWGAATFATAALVGARLPARLARTLPPPARLGVLGAAALSLATLLVWPPPAVVTEAFKTEGSVLFPFLAGLHERDAASISAEAAGRYVHPDWLEPRDGAPAIPPSQPSLLPEKPIVIFLTIDALRAEVLDDPNLRRRVPHLAELADQSVTFTNARTPGSTTRNTLGSIFASKYHSQLDWTKVGRGRSLAEDPTPRLSDRMQAAGYYTVYLVPYAPIAGKYRVLGKFRSEVRLRPERPGQRFPLSEDTVDEALRRIERLQNRKLFLYMHWMDPHDPYDAAGKDGPEVERYLREIELCDRSFGRFWKGLAERKLLDRTVLVLSADHGEALGQHGIPHHGGSLYEVLVRVPLVFRVPGVSPRRVDTPVLAMDIAPSLLDLVGAPTPGAYMGQSLVPFLRGEDPHLTRPIAADQVNVKAMVFRHYKVIDNRKRNTIELFDLQADPDETRNLYGEAPERDAELLGALRNFFAVHRLYRDDDDGGDDDDDAD